MKFQGIVEAPATLQGAAGSRGTTDLSAYVQLIERILKQPATKAAQIELGEGDRFNTIKNHFQSAARQMKLGAGGKMLRFKAVYAQGHGPKKGSDEQFEPASVLVMWSDIEPDPKRDQPHKQKSKAQRQADAKARELTQPSVAQTSVAADVEDEVDEEDVELVG